MKINQGDRDSLLTMARRATGELEGDVPDHLQQELDQAKQDVAPFDWEILQKAAHRLEEDQAPRPAPKRVRPWLRSLIPILVAAIAIIVVIPKDDGSPTTRAKGQAYLVPSMNHHVMRGDQVFPQGRLETLQAGDRLQFTIDPAGHTTLVLLSIDGESNVTTYFPESGDQPAPFAARRPQKLPHSIEVDDAGDYEVFVAFFNADSADGARQMAVEAHDADGISGLRDLARNRDDIEVRVFRKE